MIRTFLLLVAIGALGFYYFGDQLGLEPFDYATAPPEQKQVWLDRQANKMSSSVNFHLPSGMGMHPKMTVSEKTASVNRRRIDLDITVDGDNSRRSSVDEVAETLQAKVCPRYLRTQLDENNVAVTGTIRYLNGGVARKVSFSPRTCAEAA